MPHGTCGIEDREDFEWELMTPEERREAINGTPQERAFFAAADELDNTFDGAARFENHGISLTPQEIDSGDLVDAHSVPAKGIKVEFEADEHCCEGELLVLLEPGEDLGTLAGALEKVAARLVKVAAGMRGK